MPDKPDEGATRDLNPPDQGGSESGLRPIYEQSWAVVVGINDYPHLPELRYAVADADCEDRGATCCATCGRR